MVLSKKYTTQHVGKGGSLVEDQNTVKGEKYAVMANELARSAYFDLTTRQFKILLYFVSQIKKTDTAETWYEIPVAELADNIHLDLDSGGTYYERIKKDIEKLREGQWSQLGNGEYIKSFLAESDVSDKVRVDKKTGKMTLLEKPSLEPSTFDIKKVKHWSGLIHIRFNSYVAAFLFELRGNFTMVDIEQALSMTGKHSIRLFIMLSSYLYKEKLDKNVPITQNVSLAELKTRMTRKGYENNGKFIAVILKPAIEEINQKTTKFHVEVEFKKDKYEKSYSTAWFIMTKPSREQYIGAKTYE